MDEPITVPSEVYETLEEIRESGETNMLDKPTVMYLAHERDAHETVVWLATHHDEYAEGIFRGIAPD